MDVFEALFTRRSIRKFTDEPVSDADLQLVLKAAMCAPSAHNKQPWHFVVVREKSLLASIAREAGGLTDDEAERFNQLRDKTPAEPMRFE